MSEFTAARQETSTFKQTYTSPVQTVRQQQLFTSYTREPNILRDEYSSRKVDRPDAYQFWHKKGKYNSYASRVLNTNYKTQSGQTLQINNTQGATTYNNGQGCCSGQQVTVTVVVVSRDEIEAPWREECLYLQSVVEELEKKKEVQVVKEVDNTRVNQLELELNKLRAELRMSKDQISDLTNKYKNEQNLNQELQDQLNEYRLRITELENSSQVTEQVTYLSTEVDVWKKKFVSINHEFNECQEKLMMAEAELEALRKEKSQKQTSVTTTTVRSSAQRQSGVAQSSGVYKRE